MIEIDKSDFLYKHLSKLNVDNIEEKYIEFAENGISNLKDFRAYIYSKYADSVEQEIEEDSLTEILPYYADLKGYKKISSTLLKQKLKEYKQTSNSDIYDEIVNSKLKDLIYVACLYQFKYKDVELSDIIQICSLGLMKAIEKYDENANLNLDDYIDYWVSVEIENTLTKEKDNGKN